MKKLCTHLFWLLVLCDLFTSTSVGQTLAIAGTVKDNYGNVLVGVAMAGLPGNPTTDNSGNYGAYLSPGWSGTVTPTLSGYTFSPTSRTYSNVQSVLTSQNFTGTGPTIAIAGNVKDSYGNVMIGVVMNGLPGNPTTDNSGNYGAYISVGWSGTVTPTFSGYTFSPASRTFSNVLSVQSSQNFVGTGPTLAVAGTIKDSYGNPLVGVVVSGLPTSSTTDNSGNYGAYVNAGWSGTVTPTFTGYTFSPVSRSYSNVQSVQSSQNFVGTGSTIAVAGTVRDNVGNVLVGVVMNGLPGNPATDNSGNYGAYVNLGWSGTVTPSKAGYSFSPSSRSYSIVQSVQSVQNYTGTPPSVSVTSPNGGESWIVGTVQTVTWTKTSAVEISLLYFSTDGGQTFTMIGSSNGTSYSWTIPNTPSTTCKFEVIGRDIAGTFSIYDLSDNNFTIASPAPVVTSPNGSERWIVGTGHAITWTSTGISNVKIEYSTNAGSSWVTIVNSTAATTGSYSWTVPNTPTIQAIVRVSDVTNSATFDVSNANCSIVQPTVQVVSPNGGENWAVGSVHTVSWTASTDVTMSLLYYSTDGGQSFAMIGSSNVTTYSWTVPNTPSTTCRFEVIGRDQAGTFSVYDLSDNNFTISAASAITVGSPNGGERWIAGTTQTITWSSTGISNVKLEYSTNNGTSWIQILASTPASAGSMGWTIPATSTTAGLVRISDASNAGVSDISNAVFTIVQPTVQVISPNGGEVWTAGTQKIVSWSKSLDVYSSQLSYSTNGGQSFSPFGPINRGTSYSWTVPYAPSTSCRVEVIGKDSAGTFSVFDVSDANFTIVNPTGPSVTSPNGTERWVVRTIHSITWSSGSATNVKLEYSTDNGSSWTQIAASVTASAGSYSWTIPATATSQALVRVSDAAGFLSSDVSDAVFSIIQPSVAVTSPNGGESWNVGSAHSISWTKSAEVQFCTISYSTTSGQNFTTIGTSTGASLTWTIPNVPSSVCRIQVIGTDSAGTFIVTDSSDNVFTITAGRSHFSPLVWSGTPYQAMNIYVTSAAIDNVNLAAGDEIGVYDGQYLVGAAVLAAPIVSPGYVSIIASTDDPLTSAVDGFTGGHAIAFKIWKTALSAEYLATPTFTNGGPTFGSLGTAVVTLAATSTQLDSLLAGWNIVSFYLTPQSINMLQIFQPLITNSTLVKVQDESGKAMEQLPAPIGWVNNIGNWSPTEGYYVKVSAPGTLSISGAPIGLPLTVRLSLGWNILSYPLSVPISALTAVQPLIGRSTLVKVQAQIGTAIEKLPAPIGWVNNIGSFVPGQGYYVKVSAVDSLAYAVGGATYKLPVSDGPMHPLHFQASNIGNPYLPMNIYLTIPSKSGIKEGAEIGVFDNSVCVGGAVVTASDISNGYVSLIAASDDPTTERIDGFLDGHSVLLKVWDGDAVVGMIKESETGAAAKFVGRGSVVLSVRTLETGEATLPTQRALVECYPNPFNPSTHVTYTVEKPGYVTLAIYNVVGEKIRDLVSEEREAGDFRVTWDGNNTAGVACPTGVYLVRLTTVATNALAKVILLK